MVKCRKKRQIVAVILTLAMLCSCIGITPAEAEAAEPTTYPYEYTIQNFLSDYQFVVSENLKQKSHTVGGVVVGKDCTMGSFGDAMVMPSYASHLVGAGDLQSTKYDGIPDGYASNTFYYETMDEGAIASYLEPKFKKGTFVDVPRAFEQISVQSKMLAKQANDAVVKNGDVITLDLSKGSQFNIPATMLKKDGAVTVLLTGINSPDAFIDKAYTISFTGINNSSLFFDYGYSNGSGDYKVVFRYRQMDKPFANILKGITTESYSGAQYVNSGMKLIMNLPDASGDVTVDSMSGHLVAPGASVLLKGGNFEGGVIARSVDASQEGHFYPYYKVGGERSSSEVEVEKLGGKITIQGQECSTLKNQFDYSLSVKEGTPVKLESLDSNDTIYYFEDTSGQVTSYTKEELDGKTFIPYDPANPPLLTVGKTVIYEKVVDDKDPENYVYVNSEALVVKDVADEQEIVKVKLDKDVVSVGDKVSVEWIQDDEGLYVIVSEENADFQWQKKDDTTGMFVDIPGATKPWLIPDESLEAKEIQCVVTGKNGYTGEASSDGVVRALPPVVTDKTDTTITIEAEDGYEYEIRKPGENTPVVPWTKDGDSTDKDGNDGTITFGGLDPATEYDIVKRKTDTPETESVQTADSTIIQIVQADLDESVVEIGDDITVVKIKDQNGADVIVNDTNATYQWEVYNKATNTWNKIPGATSSKVPVGEDLEGQKLRCEVTGINDYSGVVYAEVAIVKAQSPIKEESTKDSITIEAEDGFEYELIGPDGKVVVPWVKDDDKDGKITFDNLTPGTEYEAVKRVPGEPATESKKTPIKTQNPDDKTDTNNPGGSTDNPGGSTDNPGGTPDNPDGTPGKPGDTTNKPGDTSNKPGANVGGNTAVKDGEPIYPGAVELNIPTIVMKKVMGPKMKFKIKLLNQKKAVIRCSSSNKKIATIDKKGLVKTKKKTGKCTLVINVSKGKYKIQYIVNLVVRKSCKKNYSLYKYKTKYKHPSVSLYKLVRVGSSYKIKLKHLNKSAKVVYKSNKKKIATVSKKGKVKALKNGRADVTVTITQNGVTYKYFVVVRATQAGIESNTSYLKVIK